VTKIANQVQEKVVVTINTAQQDFDKEHQKFLEDKKKTFNVEVDECKYHYYYNLLHIILLLL